MGIQMCNLIIVYFIIFCLFKADSFKLSMIVQALYNIVNEWMHYLCIPTQTSSHSNRLVQKLHFSITYNWSLINVLDIAD